MPTLDQMRADLAEAQAAYEKATKELPADAARERAQVVKDLKREISNTIADGAEPCEDCGAKPVGLQHRKLEVSRGRTVPYSEFEVGCVACGHKRAISRGARDDDPQGLEASRADAVRLWNEMNYLEPKPWQLEEATAKVCKGLGEEATRAVYARQPFVLEARTPTQDEAFAFLKALRAARAQQVNASA